MYQEKSFSNKFLKYGGLGLIAVGILFIVLNGSAVTPTGIISPLPEEPKLPARIGTNQKTMDTTLLLNQIKELLSDKQGVFSVYIFDLNTNIGFGINETTIFTAASVNKIYILATLYYEAEHGNIDLDKRITIQTKDIQDYGTGVIRYQGAGTVYSIKTLAQLLMEKSDNTAAFILTNLIGESRIQDQLEKWGLEQTNIQDNKTSNKDLTLILTKMYLGKIVNKARTIEMVGFMDQSDFENRLPRLLPKGIKIYHKIGNEVGNIHDVGIIVHPNRPYYLGVLTNDVIDDTSTEDAIAQISKLTYDFMIGE